MEKKNFDEVPVFKKGKFVVNFSSVVSEFESSMQKFPIKKVLYKAIFRGRGLEFDSYRQVSQGEDSELIDWKASLRGNELLARKYVEERELNIYFLVDVSNSMLFGSGNKLKAEYVAELVFALSHLIINSGDKVGLVMFNEEIVKFLPPSNSKNQLGLFSKFLSDSQLYGGGFDLGKVSRKVLDRISSPYTFFILVSDFIRMRKDCVDAVKILGSQFETISIMVRDIMDEDLPKNFYQLAIQDPYSSSQIILDSGLVAEKYKESVLRQKLNIEKIFRDSRIDLLELKTNKDFFVPMSSFLRSRASGGRL